MAATGTQYGWSNQLHEAQCQSWCDAIEFSNVLQQVATTDLSVRQNQVAMLQLIAASHKKCPAHKKTRFPNEEAWVNLTHPRLAPLIENIIAALSTSDRDNELGRVATEGSLAVNKWRAKQDARLSVTKTLSTLRQLISGGTLPLADRWANGVYTRETFEKQFELTWS